MRYANQGYSGAGTAVLGQDELLGYLRNTADAALSPMQSVLEQIESTGNPARPTAEQAAKLQWIGAAFASWIRDFPLEQPLCAQLQRLQPLAASLAIADPDFLVPGGHSLHLVMDQLQAAAVGWQPSLGRAGQAIETLLVGAVEEALAWFEGRDPALATLAARVTATTERDLARLNRMAQRLVEAEEGRIRSAGSKRDAARMINTALQQFPAPPGIGRFLKGPWYDSAQLVLLKFGPESEQWARMSNATTALLESVQQRGGEEPAGSRQQLFETVTRLPKELRLWLLSLQHDGDAVANALAAVEYVHMQILRKQPQGSEKLDLLPIDAVEAAAGLDALDAIRAGQWFRIELDRGNPVRARLVLRVEAEGQLLFANQAGIKVLQLGFEDFARLLDSGKVVHLDSGASFSRSLARAAGIENMADLDTLRSAAAMHAKQRVGDSQHLELETQEQEQERTAQLAREQARLDREQLARAAMAARLELERESALEQTQEEQEEEALQREWDEAQRRKLQRLGLERSTAAPVATKPAGADPPQTVAQPESQPAAVPATTAAIATSTALNLPMGAWLGFHDGDTPLLAKLAVHDRERDSYIFVNRNGIKMRDLNSQELLRLVDQGLVDILETRSNFRDQISRARHKTDD